MGTLGRRGFLQTLAGAIAAAQTLGIPDPEQLLWVPGAKTIFLPTPTVLKAEDVAVREIRDAADAQKLVLADARELDAMGKFDPNRQYNPIPRYQHGRYVVTISGQPPVRYNADWTPTDARTLAEAQQINDRVFGRHFAVPYKVDGPTSEPGRSIASNFSAAEGRYHKTRQG